MSLHSLPIFVRLAGRPVILIGGGEAAAAKRRLLDRAGAVVVGEDEAAEARLAIVAVAAPEAAVARLRARGVLVNAVDRPDLCDFTLPAIVDRDPVLVAIGTGGASAGLAAALRQRLEALLPASLGRLATALHAARAAMRARWPDAGERRRGIATLLAAGGTLDPMRVDEAAIASLQEAPSPARDAGGRDAPGRAAGAREVAIALASADPDDLTLRQARALANADRVIHEAGVPPAILDRARADAERLPAPAAPGEGLTVRIRMA